MKKLLITMAMFLVLSSCEKWTERPDLVQGSSVADSTLLNGNMLKKTYTLTFEFRDIYGSKVNDIFFYGDDGFSCKTAVLSNGKVTISARSKKIAVCAYDLKSRKKYGIVSMRFSSADASNRIVMPAFPKNKSDAGTVLDNFVKGIDVVNTGFTLKDLWDIFRNIKSYGLGVPGVFAIEPIPYPDSSGKPGFRIKGVLADEIFKYYPVIQGKYYYYKSY